MKTKNVVLSLITVMVMTMFAVAKDPGEPRLVVVTQKSGVFKVIYQGTTPGKIAMKIYDAKGKELFSESFNGEKGFIRPVNFDGMQPGEYTIEVADANGKQIQKVNYITEAAISNIHVSKLDAEGKYLMAIANSGTEYINVKIFDGSNNLVHNEDFTIQGNFGLVYNLKQVAGTPTFEITDNKGTVQVIK
jgi:hypothetical protein